VLSAPARVFSTPWVILGTSHTRSSPKYAP
jgi:hypothetical protein